MSTFTTRDDAGVLVVAFTDASGLNDFRNTPVRDGLLDLVKGRATPRAALDMSTIDYLSSSGVAILVGFKRKIETQEGKLVLFRLQPAVHDLLRVMKLDRYFPIVDDESEALSQLRPASPA
ncbi:STAS domain-containing protein [Paludisphaera sp.]|uniref:STAS domain-containing protein n=1 Tax=Paludisphaera sp. TaxID=2017432 RepID=UPI00301E039D